MTGRTGGHAPLFTSKEAKNPPRRGWPPSPEGPVERPSGPPRPRSRGSGPEAGGPLGDRRAVRPLPNDPVSICREQDRLQIAAGLPLAGALAEG